MKAKQDYAQKKADAIDPIHTDETQGCSQDPCTEFLSTHMQSDVIEAVTASMTS